MQLPNNTEASMILHAWQDAGRPEDGLNNIMEFRPVPPPATAPSYPMTAEYGVLSCLRVELNSGQFRCCNCRQMQLSGSPIVWVPDSVLRGDPIESIVEAARLGAFNGGTSGWCIKCAPKAGRPDLRLVEKPEFQTRQETFTLTRERVPGEAFVQAAFRWSMVLMGVLFFATAAVCALRLWGVL